MVLDFGKESSSVASSSVKVVDPPPANPRANSRKPAAVKEAGATFNPSQHRVTTRVLVSAWCLPSESSVALRQHDAAVLANAADASIFDSPDDELVTGYKRGTFEERSARTESLPRQSRKNSDDDSRANNNIRKTLGILSLAPHHGTE